MLNKIIGVTNKIMKHPNYNEYLDCLDLKWSDFLLSNQFLPVSLSNLKANVIEKQIINLNIEGVILTGGETPSKKNFGPKHKIDFKNYTFIRDLYEINLIKICIKRNIPILGVCRGLQLINLYFGGQINPVYGHAGIGKHKIFKLKSIFNISDSVNSYHDFGVNIDNLSSCLTPLAFDDNGNIEAFKHKTKKIMAVMWHPERELPFQKNDLKLFKEFFK